MLSATDLCDRISENSTHVFLYAFNDISVNAYVFLVEQFLKFQLRISHSIMKYVIVFMW